MDEFNHVTIVEPHGDDALISCCTALEALPITISTTLITLSERPSNSLIEYFDSLRKVEYKDLEDLNYKYRHKINTHEIHRMYKNDDAIVPYLRKLILKDVPLTLRDRVIDQVKTTLDSSISSDTDLLLLPSGLDHPYHLVVSDYNYSRSKIIYYLEKPYLSKRYIREYVNQYCRYDISVVHLIVEYTESLKSKKSEIFKAVYPTEQSLLRFTRQSILEDPDEYLVPVSLISEVQAMFNMAGFNTYIEKDGKYYENFDSCQPKSST